MKRESVNYFWVGIFVLAMLVLSTYLFLQISTRVDDEDVYFTAYGNVAGLSRGTAITYEGFPLGSVGEVTPRREAGGIRYQVALHVRRDWKIPQDSIARIYRSGLLSEAVVEIEEGVSTDYLRPGDSLAGEQGTDVFASIGSLAGDLESISETALKPLLVTIAGSVERLGGAMESTLPEILAKVQGLVDKLDTSAEQLSTILNPRNAENAQVAIDNVYAASTDLREFSTGLTEIEQQSLQLLHTLNELSAGAQPEFEASLTELREILRRVSTYSDTILHNLDSTSRNMEEFSRQIRANPSRLINAPSNRAEGQRRD